ncbi:MAG: beta-lactamase family protein, partial [Acidobacteria bacterium]|nr:beta-lactamase family protein [Acidobacteriota bacterium]
MINRKIKIYHRVALIFVFCLLPGIFANGQSLPVAAPQSVGMSAEKLNQIDALVEKDIADKKLPGAVILVGHKGKVVYRKAFGNRALVPSIEKMTVDTIFDVASLTKSVATATSIMILVERGQIRLNDPIGKFIPKIEDENIKKVTIQQLLTHVSGFAPDFDLREKWTGNDGMLQALNKEKLRQAAGTRFVYSDIGFIVLGEIVERVSKIKLGYFPREEVFEKLGMKNSSFRTDTNLAKTAAVSITSIAPTENIKGQNSYLGSKFEGDEKTGNQMLRGKVHDPTAFRMGGVAGHAGLFSTADDLARFCQMLLNGGILDGKRI